MTESPNRIETLVRRVFVVAAVFWAIYLVVSLISGDGLGQVIAGVGLILTTLQLWAQSRSKQAD